MEGVFSGSVAALSDVRFSLVVASFAILMMLIAAAGKLFNKLSRLLDLTQ